MDDTDESVQVAQLIVGLAEHDSPDDQKNTSEGYSKQFRRIWKNLYIEKMLTHEDSAMTFSNLTIKGRWKLKHQLGKGAFGEVYSAWDNETRQDVAIKIEPPTAKKQVLKLEINALRKIPECGCIPKFIACGKFIMATKAMPPPNPQLPPQPIPDSTESPIYTYMVMEILGPNLSELRKKMPDQKLSLATTSLLGKQMLRSMQAVHEAGILHRDVKPGNFCLSQSAVPGTRPDLYLIDFGLSRRYLGSNGQVREARASVGFRGTARYASIHAHLGKDLGRVDDLWSLFYLVVEFLKGSLPWKGKEKDKIGPLKQKHTNHTLISGLPIPITQLYEYLTTLSYNDKPDYDLMAAIFDQLFDLSGAFPDVMYDWDTQTAFSQEEKQNTSVRMNSQSSLPNLTTSVKALSPSAQYNSVLSPQSIEMLEEAANHGIFGSAGAVNNTSGALCRERRMSISTLVSDKEADGLGVEVVRKQSSTGQNTPVACVGGGPGYFDEAIASMNMQHSKSKMEMFNKPLPLVPQPPPIPPKYKSNLRSRKYHAKP